MKQTAQPRTASRVADPDLPHPTEMQHAVRIAKLVGCVATVTGDCVAVEEPLEIRVNRRPVAVTMRTPGNDGDLAVGFMLTEQIILSAQDVAAIRQGAACRVKNRVSVTLSASVKAPAAAPERRYAASACGLCGLADIARITRTAAALPAAEPVAGAILYGLPLKLRAAQECFSRTGGLHAAALFTLAGELVACAEDIGRHNAVDKVLGRALLMGTGPRGLALMISGRAGFEIVQKAAVAGCPVVCSVSAPSSMAVKLAAETGMLLAGFVRGETMNVYAGMHRLAT